jgi:hypothetical protein
MLELSNNKASMARACWAKYKFYAIDGLKPIRRERALTLGEVVHSAFDQLYSGKKPNTILSNISDSYDTMIKLAEQSEMEDLIIDKLTALGMVEFYPLALSNFESMESEVEFNVPLGWGLKLIGRIDGKVKQSGKRWVREIKTTSVSLKQFEGRARCSYQASGYKFAAEKSGEKYEGVMFDYLRKPKLYKRDTDNAESFGKRIYEDYSKTRTDEAKRNSYFGRVYVYRNDYEMECFLGDMRSIGKEIRRRTNLYSKGKPCSDCFPRNPDACFLFNRPCEYAVICWKKDVPRDLVEAYFVRRSDEKKATETIVNGEEDNGTA